MQNPFSKAVGAAMILAPIAGLVSAIVSPALKSDTAAQLAEIARHQDRWYVYAVFMTVSMWFFVPALIGLVGLVAEQAPRLGLIGGGLALLGALIATGDATTELMYWQMGAPGADRAQMVALSDRYDNATGAALLFTVGGLALLAGLVLLAVALWRTRLAPLWVAVGLPVGGLVNIVGFSVNSNLVVTLSNVVLLAALGFIGRRLLVEGPPSPRRVPGFAPAEGGAA
jgi:hypothetical protein